jgi:hypothetical protein
MERWSPAVGRKAGSRERGHAAEELLERPLVHYVGNQPARAREHFYGLRAAKPDLVGVALYDRLDSSLNDDPHLVQLMWKRREIENYVASPEVLRAYALEVGGVDNGELFPTTAVTRMDEAIDVEVTEKLDAIVEAASRANPAV